MTRVYCLNVDCAYLDSDTGLCGCSCITIGDEYECGCENYEPYNESPDYQEEFYIAVYAENKVKARAKAKGKKIIYEEREFFTRDTILASDFFNVTDKRTGLAVGFSYLKSHWEKYLEAEKNYPDVETLPLAVFDEHSQKYKLVEEKEQK